MEQNFREWFNENDDPSNVLSVPPLTTGMAFAFLEDYLLPKGWYTTIIGGNEQINVEVVHQILMDHSKKYRMEYHIDELKYYIVHESNFVFRFIMQLQLKHLMKKYEKGKWK